MEIHEALDRFQVQLDADGRSIHTRRQYARHIRLLGSWLQETGRSTDVREITHEHVAAFLAAPAARMRPDARQKKPTAVNALRSSVRVFLAFCHDAGYTPTNSGHLIRRARCQPPPPRGLSQDEQRRLLDVLARAKGEAGERDRVLFELMLASGIRVGSAVALDVGDVDLGRGELLLRVVKGGGGGLVVYFNARVRDLLAGLIGDRTEGPVFESRHRRRLSARQVGTRLAYWCRAAGVREPTCPHALRHTFGQALYDRTRDPFLVQAALGHRSIASTLVYARVQASRIRELVMGS